VILAVEMGMKGRLSHFLFFVPSIVIQLCNNMHFLNECFNSILLVFYMFRISCVHHQEDCIVHAALYVFHSFMQAAYHVEGCVRACVKQYRDSRNQTCNEFVKQGCMTGYMKLSTSYHSSVLVLTVSLRQPTVIQIYNFHKK